MTGVEPRPSRPRLPPGYGIEKATGPPGERLPWKQVGEWLAAARNYWVCTTRPDGRPHTKPVWGLWLDGTFTFSTHPETVTARNLRTNPEVAVHLESGDQVLTVEGTGRRTYDRSFLTRFGRIYGDKYRWPMGPEDVDPENPDAAFYVIRPRRALSWAAATEVGETITRWTFENGVSP
jgi:hypothetical protein